VLRASPTRNPLFAKIRIKSRMNCLRLSGIMLDLDNCGSSFAHDGKP